MAARFISRYFLLPTHRVSIAHVGHEPFTNLSTMGIFLQANGPSKTHVVQQGLCLTLLPHSHLYGG